MSEVIAIQDRYPEEVSYCYGCGRLNAHGHHIQSFAVTDGEGTIGRFTPQPYHIAFPGFVYGGLLASLIDCHSIATAAHASAEDAGQPHRLIPRYVTGSLHVDYLRPTPLGPTLELRAHVTSSTARKAIVAATITVDGVVTVRGEVVAVVMPETMKR